MSKFTPQFTEHYELEGDKITVTYSRLKRTQLAAMQPFFKEVGGEVTVDFSDATEFVSVAATVLKDCVKHFSGLKTAEGEEITRDNVMFESEVLAGTYFQELLQEMIIDVMGASGLGDRDAKKSHTTPPVDSPEQTLVPGEENTSAG